MLLGTKGIDAWLHLTSLTKTVAGENKERVFITGAGVDKEWRDEASRRLDM